MNFEDKLALILFDRAIGLEECRIGSDLSGFLSHTYVQDTIAEIKAIIEPVYLQSDKTVVVNPGDYSGGELAAAV